MRTAVLIGVIIAVIVIILIGLAVAGKINLTRDTNKVRSNGKILRELLASNDPAFTAAWLDYIKTTDDPDPESKKAAFAAAWRAANPKTDA